MVFSWFTCSIAVQAQDMAIVETAAGQTAPPAATAAESIDDPGTGAEEPVTAEQIQLQQTIYQYADRVLQLEIENGAYNNDLVEELTGLGHSYSSMGNHADALKVFSRALHINRINQGLQNMNQIPILDMVIQANNGLSDYKALNDNYGYLLWVYNRNYGDNNINLAPIYNRVAGWHLDAYEVTPSPDSVGHLVIAANLYSKAIEIIESYKGPDDPDLITPLYGIVNANFKLVEPYGFIPNIDSFISGKITPLLPSNFDSENQATRFERNSYTALDYNQEHLSRILGDQKSGSSLVQNSYKSGRNALERIVDIHTKNPDLPTLSHAYALTHLGDWYLRFYKRTSALTNYERAYQLLKMNGYDFGNNTRGLFGRPQSLDKMKVPDVSSENEPYAFSSLDDTGDEDPLAELEQHTSDDKEADSQFVVVEFNVTQYGAVRDLVIIEANPSDSVRFRRMARNRISTTPFRPRLEDGKPIETENVKMLYRFN